MSQHRKSDTDAIDDASAKQTVSHPTDDESGNSLTGDDSQHQGLNVDNADDGIIDGVDKSIANTVANIFINPFREDYHPQPPEIPEDNIVYTEQDDGSYEVSRVIPTMIRPFRCEYYLTPKDKVFLAKTMAASMVVFLLLAISISFYRDIWVILGFVITAVIFANSAFIYNNLALWKVPMPRIPLHKIDIPEIEIPEPRKSRRQLRRERDEAYIEYMKMMTQEPDMEYVEQVNRYSPNGNPSPATILTQWMNNIAQWTTADLKEASGGEFTTPTVRMLLRDNEDMWTDEETLDILAKITGSNVSDWTNAYNMWREDEDSDE